MVIPSEDQRVAPVQSLHPLKRRLAVSLNFGKGEFAGLVGPSGSGKTTLLNILSGIISYPELMMMKLPQDSPVRADLQKVMESGQRAAGVVADLLTVARGAATVKEIVCLNDLIRNYMTTPEFHELMSLYAEVDFVPRLAPDVRDILCSPIHMQKVLFNLVNNAAESINGAGQVEIRTCMR